MYDAVLVPIDGSTDSDAAFGQTVSIARTTGATVHVLYVIETTDVRRLGGDELEERRRTAEERAKRALSSVADRTDDVGISLVREMNEGAPSGLSTRWPTPPTPT